MAKRRDLELAFLAALLAAAPGCAGKPVLPWSSKTSTQPASIDELAANSAAANKPSWTERFAIKPKVIPAKDATSLGNTPTKVGADVFVQGARMHEANGNFDQAQQQYHKAIEADPKSTAAMIGLARLHDRQQNFAEAEKVYAQAAKIEPKNATVWNDLGLCYARQKRLAEATKSIDYAVKLQPQNKMYRNNLATVLVEAGDHDKAWAQLTALNEPAVAHYNMAYLLSQRQQNDLALEHARQALQADPSLTAADTLLAKLQGTAGVTEDLAIDMPSKPSPSYTISDETITPVHSSAVAATPAPAAEDTNQYVATGPTTLVNPATPTTRRSATYRMPPTEEQSDDPAPAPARLPEVAGDAPTTEEAPADGAEEGQLELGNPSGFYPSRRITHQADDAVRQPNTIRLLGTAPITAPIPTGE